MSRRRSIGAHLHNSSIKWTEDSASSIYKKVSDEEELSDASDIKAIKNGELLDNIREESSETSEESMKQRKSEPAPPTKIGDTENKTS